MFPVTFDWWRILMLKKPKRQKRTWGRNCSNFPNFRIIQILPFSPINRINCAALRNIWSNSQQDEAKCQPTRFFAVEWKIATIYEVATFNNPQFTKKKKNKKKSTWNFLCGAEWNCVEAKFSSTNFSTTNKISYSMLRLFQSNNINVLNKFWFCRSWFFLPKISNTNIYFAGAACQEFCHLFWLPTF